MHTLAGLKRDQILCRLFSEGVCSCPNVLCTIRLTGLKNVSCFA